MNPSSSRRFRALAALVLLVATTITATPAAEPLLSLRTDSSTFNLSTKGTLTSISDHATGRDYLAPDQPASLLNVRVDGTYHAPDKADWNVDSERITLHYTDAGVTVTLAARAKPTHAVFEVIHVHPAERIELVLWGPYPTTITGIIGEIVGVVRDSEFAVGIQALNVKTLGGYPTSENDIERTFGAKDEGNYPDLPAELTDVQGFRGETAKATPFGSVLQAYCRNRNHDRVIANWGHDKYLAPAFPDGGPRGSKIALFACPAPKALETIGAIELAEGLPHPILDGVWAKVSPEATASYLIVDFSERNVDRAIEMTKRAGLRYIYHSSPFATWGHFRLKPELFPTGSDGLRDCVEKARVAGVRVGLHTLSNFITPSDPYVTPKPDPRLARTGSSHLTADIDPSAQEIPLASLDYFTKGSTLNTAMIGEELVRFAGVSTEAPWRLLGCQRGAWGTRAASHAQGATVAKLLDHPYQVFFGDADLSQEIARNLAHMFNHAGALQVSFDGLEGNWSTALGQYGRSLFTKAWHDALSEESRGNVISDASNPSHFNWHINTRMNWGEPWYAGFRESQTLYRFKNQVLFERNFMPRMLGWFALRPDTSIEDAEWLLARAAGFDAGFALATSLASTAQLQADPSSADTAQRFGAVPAILESIKQWETARMSKAFPRPIKARLRDNTREFHLRPVGEGRWDLHEVHSARFASEPGQSTPFEFQNPDVPQSLHWIIRSSAQAPVTKLTLELNGLAVLNLEDRSMPPNSSLKYTGGPDAVIYDAAWKELARVPVDPTAARLAVGTQRVQVGGPPDTALKVELRAFGPATRIASTLTGDTD